MKHWIAICAHSLRISANLGACDAGISEDAALTFLSCSFLVLLRPRVSFARAGVWALL